MTAAIAAFGVCAGVAALIAVISAMSGYQAEVRDKIRNTNATPSCRSGPRFTDWDEVSQKVHKVPGVVATTPFIFTGGMLVVDSVEAKEPAKENEPGGDRTTFAV